MQHSFLDARLARPDEPNLEVEPILLPVLRHRIDPARNRVGLDLRALLGEEVLPRVRRVRRGIRRLGAGGNFLVPCNPLLGIVAAPVNLQVNLAVDPREPHVAALQLLPDFLDAEVDARVLDEGLDAGLGDDAAPAGHGDVVPPRALGQNFPEAVNAFLVGTDGKAAVGPVELARHNLGDSGDAGPLAVVGGRGLDLHCRDGGKVQGHQIVEAHAARDIQVGRGGHQEPVVEIHRRHPREERVGVVADEPRDLAGNRGTARGIVGRDGVRQRPDIAMRVPPVEVLVDLRNRPGSRGPDVAEHVRHEAGHAPLVAGRHIRANRLGVVGTEHHQRPKVRRSRDRDELHASDAAREEQGPATREIVCLREKEFASRGPLPDVARHEFVLIDGDPEATVAVGHHAPARNLSRTSAPSGRAVVEDRRTLAVLNHQRLDRLLHPRHREDAGIAEGERNRLPRVNVFTDPDAVEVAANGNNNHPALHAEVRRALVEPAREPAATGALDERGPRVRLAAPDCEVVAPRELALRQQFRRDGAGDATRAGLPRP